MEFSGQYLTYEEYRSLGGTLDLTPFNLLEFEARRKIDSRTMNRLKDIDSQDIPQEVKICEYNVINSINSYVNTFESANKNTQTIKDMPVTSSLLINAYCIGAAPLYLGNNEP